MRIAFVAQPFDTLEPPVQDGSLAIWIYQVARRCAGRGHETFVFANHGAPMREVTKRYEDVEYVFTPTKLNGLLNRVGSATFKWLPRRTLGRNSLPAFAAPWSDAGYAIEVARRLRRLRCDAVLVMNYSQFVPIIRRLYPECTIYLYMQCEWLTQLNARRMGARIAAADLVGGCSPYITAKIAERFPDHANKCVTLTNAGIPPECTDGHEAEAQSVLFVGRVSPEKGVHDLVDAFRIVLERFPRARLHVVGGASSAPLEFLVALSDDPYVSALRRFYESPPSGSKDPYLVHLERSAGADLGTRIILHGRVDHDRTTEAYRQASVLVNPSLSESFGMTLVEAMMHEVPVIATRVGGMPHIVDDGETGLLVDPADPPALANAICTMFADPAQARAMGKEGKARATGRFTWDRTAQTLLGQLAGVRA